MKEFYLKMCLRQHFMQTGELELPNEEMQVYAKKYAKEMDLKYSEYLNYLLHGYLIDGIKPSEVVTLKCWKICGKYEHKSKNILERAGLTKDEAFNKIAVFDTFNRYYKELNAIINYIIATDAPAATIDSGNINLVELLLGSRVSGNIETINSVREKSYRKVIAENILGLSIAKADDVCIRMCTLLTPNKITKEKLIDLCIDYIGTESPYVTPDILAILKDITNKCSLQQFLVSGDELAEDIWQMVLDLGLAIKMQLQHFDSDLPIKNVADLLVSLGYDFYNMIDANRDLVYCNKAKTEFSIVNPNASNTDCVIKVSSKDIGAVLNKDVDFKTSEVLHRNKYQITPNVAFVNGRELSKIISVMRRPNSHVNDYTN